MTDEELDALEHELRVNFLRRYQVREIIAEARRRGNIAIHLANRERELRAELKTAKAALRDAVDGGIGWCRRARCLLGLEKADG